MCLRRRGLREKKERIEQLVMKTRIPQQQWLREELKNPLDVKRKEKVIKSPEISRGYLSMNKGREFLGSHQSFTTLPFQKKSQIKTSSLMVPNSILIKLCWPPHSAKLRCEEGRVNGS